MHLAAEGHALAKGFIDARDVERLIASRYAKSDYGRYLQVLLEEDARDATTRRAE